MRRLRYDKDVRPLPLLLALQGAGVPVRQVLPGPGYADIEVEDGADEATIAAVVAAHDPAAIDAAVATDIQQFQADVAGLKQYQAVATPTLAQTAAAVKALSRVLRRVLQELR